MNLFTVDIDWAPEEVIEDTLRLFEEYHVQCTIFATHKSSIIDGCNRRRFEIGIHPNFNPLLFEGRHSTTDTILQDILTLYPEAKGVRSHSLTQNSYFVYKFAEMGLKYDANTFLPYWKDIKPYRMWNNFMRVPYNWEDDIHFLYKKDYRDCELDLNTSLINIFGFHPIHVYLNTECENRYQEAKKDIKNPEALLKHRNLKTYGTRNFLISLLTEQQRQRNESVKLIDILNSF